MAQKLAWHPAQNGLGWLAGFSILLAAIVLTCLSLFFLPAMDLLAPDSGKRIEYRPVQTLEWKPALVTPRVPQPVKQQTPKSPRQVSARPQPALREPSVQPRPKLPMALDFHLASPAPDLALDFEVASGRNVIPGEVGIAVEAATVAEELPMVEEKRIFTEKEVDSPPRVLSRVSPVYPYRAKIRGWSGFVELEFVVLETGVPSGIEIRTSQPGHVFEQAAREAVAKWRFQPAVRQGRKVPCRMTQKINFALQEHP